MAAAFDDEPQIVVAGEVDRHDDVPRRLGCHGVDTWLGHPRVDPARGLSQTDFITDVIRIFQFSEEIAA
jgi:hypothetical protein